MTYAAVKSGELDWTPVISVVPAITDGEGSQFIDLTSYPEGIDETCDYHPLQGVFRNAEGVILREPPPVLPPPSFVSLTPLQLRTWLLVHKGLDDAEVMALIDASPLPAQEKAVAHIAWQYALSFERTHPMIAVLSQMMTPPMSSEEIDEAFISARA